ncbi:hypothetical protein N7456_001633 [Penicillium angulare]|uniref:Serine hydrolase domain-containing protein n=1 Tax=Penicillium angulare TaxID=116970 RepID=A0A9W9KNA1_9EURO|nr:hypothetical protein N7456_001633 [Penicillium angulare]
MRVLMLHGHATSATIFKAQMMPIMGKLGNAYTFDFVDGPVSCPPPKGMGHLIPTAYTWFKTPSLEGLRESADWLTNYIEKNGPYDCICTFSKGAVPVITMMMDESRDGHERRMRCAPKCVVFMNGSIEYALLEENGLPVSDQARRTKYKCESTVKAKQDSMAAISRATVKPVGGIWDDKKGLLHNAKKIPPPSNCYGLDFNFLPQESLINMPSAHIVGAKDPIFPSGVQLANLFNPDLQSFHDHQGGHDLPRTPQVTNHIAGVFRQLNVATCA